jgi:hypothetical protein
MFSKPQATVVPKTYRKAVDIDENGAFAAFDKIPISVLGSSPCTYTNKKFKNAPTWQKAAKLVPCVSLLVDASGGRAIHQKQLDGHMRKWVAQNDVEISEEKRDDVVYSVRALVCQLLNHKRKGRSIPQMWASRFQVLFDKLMVDSSCVQGDSKSDQPQLALADDDDYDPDDVDDSSEPEVVPIQPKKIDVVDLSDTDSQDFDLDAYKKKVFDSDDADLKELLEKDSAAEAPRGRRRLTSKTSENASAVIKPGMLEHEPGLESVLSKGVLSALASGDLSGGVTPAKWRALKAAQKKGDRKPMKRKKCVAKAMKKKKGHQAKAVGNISWKCFAKREHSKVWHSERTLCMAAGMNKEAAGKNAAEKARKHAASLRERRAKGEFAEYS